MLLHREGERGGPRSDSSPASWLGVGRETAVSTGCDLLLWVSLVTQIHPQSPKQMSPIMQNSMSAIKKQS